MLRCDERTLALDAWTFTMGQPRDPSPDYVQRVLTIVRQIPPGRVMTYGDIAGIVGSHADVDGAEPSEGPRLVGHVMSRFGGDTPWWRVIRSTGQPPRFHEREAHAFYVAERTPLTGSEEQYRVDLKLARWDPDNPDEPMQAAIPGW
jgi:alkylated DNA nucleotide flippase Atl1